VVTWLSRSLSQVVGAFDAAATAATRRYSAWLRDGCPPDDHMPNERRSLRAHWYRDYLRIYGATLAARIAGRSQSTPRPVSGGQLYHTHWADLAAEHDAAQVSLAVFTPPPAVSAYDSPLRIASATTRALPRKAGSPRRRRSVERAIEAGGSGT
jgi:hypothetical protein